MRHAFAPAVAALLLALAGCGADDPELPSVNGSTYIMSIVDSVDQMRVDRDCAAMQRAFDAADRNEFTDLMAYTDASMRYAGCYGDDPVSLTKDACYLDAGARSERQRDYAEAMACD